MFIRLKVCCISSIKEAQIATHYGAHALGLVGDMPSGPGIISLALAREIALAVPPGLATFLLTAKTTLQDIVDEVRFTNVNTVQLVDTVDLNIYPVLRTAIPNVKIVQVLHVQDDRILPYAQQVADFVDALLLDSGNPQKEVKELGGTGRTHNWNISRKIVQTVNKPVFLAGGIDPTNVQTAIETVQPYGIDLCSGLRTNGQLDEIKLANLMQSIRATSKSWPKF
jgi:phosphoribosylanthranilate isomerase